jgi:nucleoside-diphosphate-sugar epimerase
MRVFVTGATGFIGSAIVKELLDAGHRVLGLTRSDAGAKAVAAVGAEVHRGSLEDLESLKRGAAAVDGVIHTAFIHDFADFAASVSKDKAAIEALTAALAGSNKPLIVTSGCLGLRTEEEAPPADFPRRSEQAGLAAVSQGVRAMVVRLPPSVHGDGDHGFVPALIKLAREKGCSIYVAEGQNRWPAVHRLDAAKLFRLALEKGSAGAVFHGVGDEGIATRRISEIIARRMNVPSVSKTPEEATALLGFIGHVLGLGGPSSSALTQERLGWKPTQLGLVEDLERGTYFDQ